MELWRRDRTSRDRWQRTALSDDGIALCGVHEVHLQRAGAAAEQVLGLVLPASESGARAILLTAPASSPAILHNGRPASPVTALDEHDELVVAGERFWLRAPAPQLLAYPAERPEGVCARCKRPIVAGDAVALCSCGLWCHEGAIDDENGGERRCWSHYAHCPAGHPRADLDAPVEDADDDA